MQDYNLIIFGSSGYVGTALKNKLSNKPKCTFVSRDEKSDLKINICNKNDFKKLPINSRTILILLAAISSPDLCSNRYEESFKINFTSTTNLIDFTLMKGGKVIFFSSDVVYGDKNQIFNEESVCNPKGAYGEMKRSVEERYLDNKNVKIIRPSYIYSFKDRFSQYLLYSSNDSKKAKIFHPLYRNIVYLGDVLDGIIKLIDQWNFLDFNIINFGGTNLLSRKDIAHIYKDKLIKELEFEIEKPSNIFYESRPISIEIDSSRFKSLLGRKPLELVNIISNPNYLNL